MNSLSHTVNLFLTQHPEFGASVSFSDLPDWAHGKRVSAACKLGWFRRATYIFYLPRPIEHKKEYVPVANGAGRIVCSCGWRSAVQGDACMFDVGRFDAEKAFREHIIDAVTACGVRK